MPDITTFTVTQSSLSVHVYNLNGFYLDTSRWHVANVRQQDYGNRSCSTFGSIQNFRRNSGEKTMENDIIGSEISVSSYRRTQTRFSLQQTGSTIREGTNQTICQHAGCDFWIRNVAEANTKNKRNSRGIFLLAIYLPVWKHNLTLLTMWRGGGGHYAVFLY